MNKKNKLIPLKKLIKNERKQIKLWVEGDNPKTDFEGSLRTILYYLKRENLQTEVSFFSNGYSGINIDLNNYCLYYELKNNYHYNWGYTYFFIKDIVGNERCEDLQDRHYKLIPNFKVYLNLDKNSLIIYRLSLKKGEIFCEKIKQEDGGG